MTDCDQKLNPALQTNSDTGAPLVNNTTCIIQSRSQMWDEAAEWWAGHLKEDKNRRLQVFPVVLRLLGEVPGVRVLDAGCGEGSFARLLADAGANVTGVDFSRLLDAALEEERRQPRGIHYIEADLADLQMFRM